MKTFLIEDDEDVLEMHEGQYVVYEMTKKSDLVYVNEYKSIRAAKKAISVVDKKARILFGSDDLFGIC